MVLAAVLVLGVAQRGAIVSTSFPEIYIWPYLLLVIAAASVISGEQRDLPWALVAIGLLCHGHVSFVLFGAGFLFVMVAALWQRRRDDPLSRSVIIKCVVVGFVFLLPFLLNLLLHWPGELEKYWRYTQSSKTGGHPWSSIFRFIASFWSVQGTIGYALVGGLLVATALLVRRVDHPMTRSIAFGLLVTTVVSTVLLAVYAYRGIDDLTYRYVAEFYLTAPVVTLLAVGSVSVAGHVREPRMAPSGWYRPRRGHRRAIGDARDEGFVPRRQLGSRCRRLPRPGSPTRHDESHEVSPRRVAGRRRHRRAEPAYRRQRVHRGSWVRIPVQRIDGVQRSAASRGCRGPGSSTHCSRDAGCDCSSSLRKPANRARGSGLTRRLQPHARDSVSQRTAGSSFLTWSRGPTAEYSTMQNRARIPSRQPIFLPSA